MYNIIKNPETNRNVSIYSEKGIAILEKYLNNLTGGWGMPKIMTPDSEPMKFIDKLYIDNIPPMFRNEYNIGKEEIKYVDYVDYKNELKKILEIIKKKSNDEQKIEEITNYYNDEIRIEYPHQNCPICAYNALSRYIVIVKLTKQQYLYKNMVLFLFTPNPCFSRLKSKHQLIKELYKVRTPYLNQTINIINGKMYDLFLKHINIIQLKKNNWNDEVKNLIYRFHLTNIISVLLILTKNLSDLESEDQYYKSLKEKVMENIEDIENFSEQKEIEKLINYSEENVDFLIVINDKLCRLLSDIFNVKEKEKHQILQGYDTTKKNLVDIMEHFNSF